MDPKNSQAHHNKGLALNELKMYAEAIKEFEEAITINPNFFQAYNSLGTAYNSLENIE